MFPKRAKKNQSATITSRGIYKPCKMRRVSKKGKKGKNGKNGKNGKKSPNNSKYSEKAIQRKICDAVKKKYPKLIFTTMGQFSTAREAGQSVINGYYVSIPDFIFLSPKGIYHGLLIELKTMEIVRDNKIKKKKGKLSKKQKATSKKLMALGYFCCVTFGFEASMNIISLYMSLKPGENIDVNQCQ